MAIRNRTMIGAASLAAMLVIAGCSSSHHSSAPPTNSGGSGGTQPSGAAIKIGYIENAVSLGAGSNNPYTIPAFQAWVKWQNANGGINGHPIQLVIEREPNNPGVSLTDVQSMVHQGVIALVSDDTANENSWTSFVAKAGVPTFEATSGSVSLAVSPIGFSTQISLLSTPAAIVASAAKIGSTNMGVFYCAEIPQCAQAVPALAGAGKLIGVKVPFSTSILGSAPNYTAQCLTAKEHGATALEVADASQIIQRVAASCAQQGYTPHEITDGLNIQLSFAGAPGLDGLISFEPTMPFFETSFPGIKTMTDAFNKYDPGLTKMAGYGDLATNQWTTGLLIAAGAKAGGVGSTSPITPAAMLQGMYTLHSTNLDGMVPTMTFTPGKAQANKCWFWASTQNGKFTMPFGTTQACAS